MGKCELIADGNAIAVKSPYDAGFVNELKSRIQSTERRWKPEIKAWVVSPRHGKTAQELCEKYFNEIPLLPQIASVKPTIKQMILDVRYIGTTKDRGSDERTAFGYYKDGWNVVFPEDVLRRWFDAPQDPSEQPTLYSVLGIKRDATDDELKAGYRRMVFQWHPDRCKEPNAQEQFMAVQHAYEVLSKSRDRYDAGLALEASLRDNTTQNYKDRMNPFASGYRSPLRCGLIMSEGVESMGLFTVSKIFAWEDVRDAHGRVLVVSWKQGDDKFSEVWA